MILDQDGNQLAGAETLRAKPERIPAISEAIDGQAIFWGRVDKIFSDPEVDELVLLDAITVAEAELHRLHFLSTYLRAQGRSLRLTTGKQVSADLGIAKNFRLDNLFWHPDMPLAKIGDYESQLDIMQLSEAVGRGGELTVFNDITEAREHSAVFAQLDEEARIQALIKQTVAQSLGNTATQYLH